MNTASSKPAKTISWWASTVSGVMGAALVLITSVIWFDDGRDLAEANKVGLQKTEEVLGTKIDSLGKKIGDVGKKAEDIKERVVRLEERPPGLSSSQVTEITYKLLERYNTQHLGQPHAGAVNEQEFTRFVIDMKTEFKALREELSAGLKEVRDANRLTATRVDRVLEQFPKGK